MYFITTYENHEKFADRNSDACPVGWYKNKDQAITCVAENRCDLNETIYDLARIQFIPEGIYTLHREDMWFKFNYETKKYESTVKHVL